MSYLGLDIGTGGCKAVVFDAEGRELAGAYREYPLLHPGPCRAELDSAAVLEKCVEVIWEVNTHLTDPVEALSVSSLGEAFTPVDAAGNILHNAMVSSDIRAGEIARQWDGIGSEAIYPISGHTPHSIFSLYKLLWLRENCPQVWERAYRFLCFEDLFQWHLGMEPKISWSLAGRTMLFDVRRHGWDPAVLSAVGLEPDRLAEPVPSGTVVGLIPDQAARRLGFRRPVALVAGGHDQGMGALGAGVTEPGMCMYATGSVECFCPILDTARFSDTLRRNNLCCYDYPIPGRYTSLAYCLTGGSILRWVRDHLGEAETERAARSGKSAYTLLLDGMPDSPTRLLALPYFSASGTPHFDSGATGAILGLQLSTTKGEITKALLEGVALEMKLNLSLMEESGMRIDTFIATGGGTRDDRWTQLKADVLGKTIRVREITEAGCFGAAMLACSAVTGTPVVNLVKEKGNAGKIFRPDPEKAAYYQDRFGDYRRLYSALKDFR